MSINILKTYNFNFLFWNLTLEKFTTKVIIPKSGFINYNKKTTYFFIGKWLLTIN